MSATEPYQNCTDTNLITEISLPQQLFLKPEAKLSITVALPQVRLPGKTISNWEVMERLKQSVHPEEFIGLRVSKSTIEFIRFDAEIENRTRLPGVIALLEGKSIKLSGFPEPLKVKAAESKPDFPTRHDWDKYFRDAKNMNEMKPGERPDTIHIENIPSKWFVSKKDKRNGVETPNEFTLQKVFEVFGEVRCVDIPMLDPYRNQMKASISGIKKFSHSTDSTFDAYIQYKEYVCFVKAMNALRGMKLVHRDGGKAYSASIKVMHSIIVIRLRRERLLGHR